MLNFDLLSICNTVCPGSLVHLYSVAPYIMDIQYDMYSWNKNCAKTFNRYL